MRLCLATNRKWRCLFEQAYRDPTRGSRAQPDNRKLKTYMKRTSSAFKNRPGNVLAMCVGMCVGMCVLAVGMERRRASRRRSHLVSRRSQGANNPRRSLSLRARHGCFRARRGLGRTGPLRRGVAPGANWGLWCMLALNSRHPSIEQRPSTL